MGLLDQQPRCAAKTDCRVAAVTEQRFEKLVSQNPFLALDMMRRLSNGCATTRRARSTRVGAIYPISTGAIQARQRSRKSGEKIRTDV